eukprot:13063286-Alexandrium_andersonii.AAC.1
MIANGRPLTTRTGTPLAIICWIKGRAVLLFSALPRSSATCTSTLRFRAAVRRSTTSLRSN